MKGPGDCPGLSPLPPSTRIRLPALPGAIPEIRIRGRKVLGYPTQVGINAEQQVLAVNQSALCRSRTIQGCSLATA